MENIEYTLTEAAKRLAELKERSVPYSRQYMHKLIKEGKLSYRTVGQETNLYLTTEEDLQKLVKSMKKVGRPKNS